MIEEPFTEAQRHLSLRRLGDALRRCRAMWRGGRFGADQEVVGEGTVLIARRVCPSE